MRVVFVLLVAVVFCWVVNPALAQPFPFGMENHYLVYQLHPTTLSIPLILIDQFGTWQPDPDMIQEKWGNPLFAKNGQDVLFNLLLHHAWYRINPLPFSGTVIAEHQFGAFPLVLRDAVFLLLPSDKFDQLPGPPVPVGNHYLCYEAEGEPFDIPLQLDDQFGQWDNVAREPAYFCNPVEKIHEDGTSSGIVDPDVHLTCYRVDPITVGFPFFWDDQFGRWNNGAQFQCLVCLPSIKRFVIPTEESTWGRIKSLYGE